MRSISSRTPFQRLRPDAPPSCARRAEIELLGETFTVEGTGFTLGGGVGFFVRPGLAVDLGLLWTAGNFDEVSSGGLTGSIDEDATSARFRVGMRWWAR